MKINEAKKLKQGDLVYHMDKTNADGTPMRAKVTSVKTWKKDLTRIEVGLKHGLYDYAKYNELEIKDITTKESIAKRVYLVRYNKLSNTVDIIDRRKNKIRTFSPIQFVYGQSQFNEGTTKYPNYVHSDLWDQHDKN